MVSAWLFWVVVGANVISAIAAFIESRMAKGTESILRESLAAAHQELANNLALIKNLENALVDALTLLIEGKALIKSRTEVFTQPRGDA